MSAKKKACIMLTVILILAAAVLLIFDSMKSKPRPNEEYSLCNTNAKVIYMTLEKYAQEVYTRLDKEYDPEDIYIGDILSDGIYCGSMYSDEPMKLKDSVKYDGASQDLALYLRYLIGTPHENYYCAVIKDGKLQQVYWSSSDYVIKNARRLAAEIEREDTDEKFRRKGISEDIFGGYPISITNPSDKRFPELASEESDLPVFMLGSLGE